MRSPPSATADRRRGGTGADTDVRRQLGQDRSTRGHCMKIRVLIVEDHPLMQQGLKAALAQDSGFEVVGTADTGTAGIQMARELRPDVVLLDLHLPDMGGIAVLRQLRED